MSAWVAGKLGLKSAESSLTHMYGTRFGRIQPLGAGTAGSLQTSLSPHVDSLSVFFNVAALMFIFFLHSSLGLHRHNSQERERVKEKSYHCAITYNLASITILKSYWVISTTILLNRNTGRGMRFNF